MYVHNIGKAWNAKKVNTYTAMLTIALFSSMTGEK